MKFLSNILAPVSCVTVARLPSFFGQNFQICFAQKKSEKEKQDREQRRRPSKKEKTKKPTKSTKYILHDVVERGTCVILVKGLSYNSFRNGYQIALDKYAHGRHSNKTAR
jgi:hypothetical protein